MIMRSMVVPSNMLKLVVPANNCCRQKLQIGSQVRLNSGGPVAVIVDIDERENVSVSWRDSSGEVHEANLPGACFKRVGA